ncbi:MAG TPA: hypothetical protein VKA83_22260 [Methylomirabilota bacterium]|nr:hypothetical protein [Methylomirabilota bacterium]
MADLVVELASGWLLFVMVLCAWRLEGLVDRVQVLEQLAHPPPNRAECPKCGDQPAAATTTTRGHRP